MRDGSAMRDRSVHTRGRARIGVVPFSNTNLEPDLMMLCPPAVSIHFARTGGYDVDAIPDEHQMRRYSEAPFEEAVDSLRHCRPDVMLFLAKCGPAGRESRRHGPSRAQDTSLRDGKAIQDGSSGASASALHSIRMRS